MSADPFDVRGRVALVTGASSGLGEHFARTLAARGARVVAAARRVERLEQLVTAIRSEGGEAIALAMDVSHAESVAAGFARIGQEVGTPAIVVNNAGVADVRPSLEMTDADWRGVMDTNLDGAVRVAQAAGRALVAAKQPGSIVNIASILGMRVAPQMLAYSAAKAALVQVMATLAIEWARYGIRVNAIAPGYVETDINRDFFASDADQQVVKRIPQRRIGSPKDLDGALLLLASDAGAYMTGSTLVVDGGHVVNSL